MAISGASSIMDRTTGAYLERAEGLVRHAQLADGAKVLRRKVALVHHVGHQHEQAEEQAADEPFEEHDVAAQLDVGLGLALLFALAIILALARGAPVRRD